MSPANFPPDYLADLKRRVLPKIHSEIRLIGLMAYGSRTAGHARLDSDWDLLALVEVPNQVRFYSEYHGYLQGESGRLPVELRLFSREEMNTMLGKPDIIRISAIAKGVIIEDSSGALAVLKNECGIKFGSILRSFHEECLQMREDELIGLLQTVMSEGRSIIAALVESQNFLAAHALTLELLTDFLVYSEILRARAEPIRSHAELANLFFLRRGRGGRFLNAGRYSFSPGMDVWIQKLNRVFSAPANDLFNSIFSEMDQGFRELTGLSLFLTHTQCEETIVRPEVPK